MRISSPKIYLPFCLKALSEYKNIGPKIGFAVVLAVHSLLTSCAVVMNDGQKSTMSGNNNKTRESLKIRRVSIGRLEYGKNQMCTYKISIMALGDSSYGEKEYKFTLKRVKKDRNLCIFKDIEGNNSTCMITNTGKLVDFNLHQNFFGGTGRETKKNYAEAVIEAKEKLKKSGDFKEGATYFIQPISVILPEFEASSRHRPGSVLSEIRTHGGELWAKYIFRGESFYSGRNVYVLDIVQEGLSYLQGPLLIGYSLIDVSTSLPTYLVVDAGGTHLAVTQKSCH